MGNPHQRAMPSKGTPSNSIAHQQGKPHQQGLIPFARGPYQLGFALLVTLLLLLSPPPRLLSGALSGPEAQAPGYSLDAGGPYQAQPSPRAGPFQGLGPVIKQYLRLETAIITGIYIDISYIFYIYYIYSYIFGIYCCLDIKIGDKIGGERGKIPSYLKPSDEQRDKSSEKQPPEWKDKDKLIKKYTQHLTFILDFSLKWWYFS